MTDKKRMLYAFIVRSIRYLPNKTAYRAELRPDHFVRECRKDVEVCVKSFPFEEADTPLKAIAKLCNRIEKEEGNDS